MAGQPTTGCGILGGREASWAGLIMKMIFIKVTSGQGAKQRAAAGVPKMRRKRAEQIRKIGKTRTVSGESDGPELLDS